MSKLSRSRAARASARETIGGGVCQSDLSGTDLATQVWGWAADSEPHAPVPCPPARRGHRSPRAPRRGPRPAGPASARHAPGPDPGHHARRPPTRSAERSPTRPARSEASIDTVTGTVGDPTGAVTDTVGQTVDQVLGGTLGTLPSGTVDDLLGAAGLAGKTASTAPTAPPAAGREGPPRRHGRRRQARAGDEGQGARPQPQRSGATASCGCRSPATSPASWRSSGTVKPGRAYHLHGRKPSSTRARRSRSRRSCWPTARPARCG